MKENKYITEIVGPFELKLYEKRPKKEFEYSYNVKCENRASKEETINTIHELGNIRNCYFDEALGKVIIETDKVEHFKRLEENIFRTTGWNPQIHAPAISGLVSKARKIIYENEDRYKYMKEWGRKIKKSFETEFCRIELLGSGKEVGRTAILVQTNNSAVCLDFGINVGTKEIPYIMPDMHQNFYGIILSHAHLDHSGAIPFLFQKKMDFPIYGTEMTLFLSYLLCKDFRKVAHLNGYPSYSKKDIEKMISRFIALNFRQKVKVAPDIEIELINSGHIPGASGVILYIKGHTILYTGDYNSRKSRILTQIDPDLPKIDYLITESTYFDRTLPAQKDAEKEVVNLCNETYQNGGIAMIPSFGVGRSQEVLTFLHDYDIYADLYVDGMIREATKIVQSGPEFLRREIQTKDLTWVWREKHRKRAMDDKNIILTTSGMLTGGPIYTYLKKLHDDPKNSLILVGYQVEGTKGREVLDGNTKITIDDEEIDLKLKVYQVKLSGHADRSGLWNFIQDLDGLKKAFVIHGPRENCINLAKRIKGKLKIEAHAPDDLDAYRLF